jgi:ankyrin repeat-rich membrane spanning protein
VRKQSNENLHEPQNFCFLLKEDQQAIEDEGIVIPSKTNMPHLPQSNNIYNRNPHHFQQPPTGGFHRNLPLYSTTATNSPVTMMSYYNPPNGPVHHQLMEQDHQGSFGYQHQFQPRKQQVLRDVVSWFEMLTSEPELIFVISKDLSQMRLSTMSCDEVINLLSQLKELKGQMEKLSSVLRENAITGCVLMYCDLNELKSVLQLNFGNWEIFKILIHSLRDIENNSRINPAIKSDNRDGNDGAMSMPSQSQPQVTRKKSVIEKQVSRLSLSLSCRLTQVLNFRSIHSIKTLQRHPLLDWKSSKKAIFMTMSSCR